MPKIIYNGKEYKMGVNGNEIISFSSTTIRNNIKFGDNISTIFGKIMKFLMILNLLLLVVVIMI